MDTNTFERVNTPTQASFPFVETVTSGAQCNASSVSCDHTELKKVFKLSSIKKLVTASDVPIWKRQITTYLKLHSLYYTIESQIDDPADNAVVVSILLSTVSDKLQEAVEHAITAYEAFKILCTELQGSKEKHTISLFRSLTQINYTSVEDYMTKFRNTANQLIVLEQEIPTRVYLLAFKSTVPRLVRQYVQLIDASEVTMDLPTYLAALIRIIPQHILTQKTKLSKSKSTASPTYVPSRNPPKSTHKPYHKQSQRINHASAAHAISDTTAAVDPVVTHNMDVWTSGTQLDESVDVGHIHMAHTEVPMENTVRRYWHLDGGANAHVCGNRSLLKNIRPLDKPFYAQNFNGIASVAHDAGDLVLNFPNVSFTLYRIPIIDGCHNILATPLLAQLGISSTLDGSGLTLSFGKRTIYYSAGFKGLFYYPSTAIIDTMLGFTKNAQGSRKTSKVHEPRPIIDPGLLWHFRLGHPSKSVEKHLKNLKNITIGCITPCVSCIQGKMTRSSIRSQAHNRRGKSSLPLGRLHCDSIGPLNVESNGFRYCLLVTDEFTHYRWVVGYSSKQTAPDLLIDLLKRLLNTTTYRIQYFRSDQGTELLPFRVLDYFRSEGILPETSVAYTPQQNGTAERSNRTIQDIARTMLISSSLPLRFWFFAMAYAVYVFNRLPSVVTGYIPYELFYHTKAAIMTIRTFGSPVHCRIPLPSQKRLKFAPRTMPGIFLGMAPHQRAYLVFVPKWDKIKIVRSVEFLEHILIYRALTTAIPQVNSVYTMFLRPEPDIKKINLARSYRKLAHFDALTPPKHFNAIQFYSPEIRLKWINAYNKEVESIATAGGMVVQPLPSPDTRLISLRELFSIKTDQISGKVGYKVRICARGDLITESDPTFAPVIGVDSLRVCFLLYSNTWFMFQADISTAFLNARTDIVRYYDLPKGHPEYGTGKCWSGKCALYGLKPAPRYWNHCFDSFIITIGFKPLLTDPCLYICEANNTIVSVLKLYVDDMIVYAREESFLDNFKEQLLTRFKIRSTDVISDFVGLELHKKSTYFGISATKKILKLAKLLEISSETSANYELPLLPNTNFFDMDSEIFDPPRLFQSIMGSLNWISGWVRPDIITACNKLSQFQANPRLILFRLAKRVV